MVWLEVRLRSLAWWARNAWLGAPTAVQILIILTILLCFVALGNGTYSLFFRLDRVAR